MSDGLKVLLGALVGAIIVLLFVSRLGGGGMMGSMGSMMSGGMMSGGMMGSGLFGILFALLFLAVLVTLLIAIVLWIVTKLSSVVSPGKLTPCPP